MSRAVLVLVLALAPSIAPAVLAQDGPPGGEEMGSYHYEEFSAEELEKWKLVLYEDLVMPPHATTPSQGDTDRARGLKERASKKVAPEVEEPDDAIEDAGKLTVQARISSEGRDGYRIDIQGEARFPDGTAIQLSVRRGRVWLDLQAVATVADLGYRGTMPLSGQLASGEYEVHAEFRMEEQHDYDVHAALVEADVENRVRARTKIGKERDIETLTERLEVQMLFCHALDRLEESLAAYESLESRALAKEAYFRGPAFDPVWFGEDVSRARVEIDRARTRVLEYRQRYLVPPVPEAWGEFESLAGAALEVTDAGARAILAGFAPEGTEPPPLPDYYVPVDGAGRSSALLLPEARDRIADFRLRLAIPDVAALERACLLWTIVAADAAVADLEVLRKEFAAIENPRADEWHGRAGTWRRTLPALRERFEYFVRSVESIRGAREPSSAAGAFDAARSAFALLPDVLAAHTHEALRRARLPVPEGDAPEVAQAIGALKAALKPVREQAR